MEFPGGSVVKNLPVFAGATGDAGLILVLGKSPGEGNGKHSSILAWEISWTEETGRLSLWGLSVGHDLRTKQQQKFARLPG